MKNQSSRRNVWLLPAFAFGLSASIAEPATAMTKITCVADSNGLATALASLSNSPNNADNDEIRIRVGTYFAPVQGWRGAVSSNHDLAIRGGYTDANCTTRDLDASETILDGKNTSGVLAIDTPGFADSDVEVSGLTFQNGNSVSQAESPAGGLKISDPGPIGTGSVLVERNIFRNNFGSNPAGGTAAGGLLVATDAKSLDGSPLLVVRGNVFIGNSAPNRAAAYLFSNESIAFNNNSVSGNSSLDMANLKRVAVGYITQNAITLSNNIFRSNLNGQGSFDLSLEGDFGLPGVTAVNNDVEATIGVPVSEIGTLHLDPGFIGLGNLRLRYRSPLINGGINNPAGGLSVVDADGAPRTDTAVVDLGAYESNYLFVDGFDTVSVP